MKLETPIIEYIQNVLKACKLVGLEDVIIEQGMVRSTHPDGTVVIIHSENVPVLPFGSIGLSRLSSLQTRIDIVKSLKDFAVEYAVKDGTDYVFSLTFKGQGTKIDYRCGDPSKIKASRSAKDPSHYSVKITQDAVNMLSKGIAATGAEKASIICNSEGVSLELVDESNDVFKFIFAEGVNSLEEGTQGKFAHRYLSKLLLTVLKECVDTTIEIGSQGLLKANVYGLTMMVVPRR